MLQSSKLEIVELHTNVSRTHPSVRKGRNCHEKVFFGKLLLILLFSVTGGANVPALNELMASWGIAFGDTVLEGDFTIGPNDMNYASGTGIGKKLCNFTKKM